MIEVIYEQMDGQLQSVNSLVFIKYVVLLNQSFRPEI